MQPLKILIINIRSLMGKLTELEHICVDTKNTPSSRVVRGIALLCRPPFKELRLRARAADELV